MTLSKSFKIFIVCIIPVILLVLWFYFTKGGSVDTKYRAREVYYEMRNAFTTLCYEVDTEKECIKKSECEWKLCQAHYPFDFGKDAKNFCINKKGKYEAKEEVKLKRGFNCFPSDVPQARLN